MSRMKCWFIWVIIWFISLVTLSLADSEAVAMTRTDAGPRHCYTCPTNGSDCSRPVTSLCPKERPYCGTMASSPNFTSALMCVAEQLCSLTYSHQNQTYKFTCVCGGDRCSRPLSQELRGQLLNYASSRAPPIQNNSADLTDAFFTSSKYANVTKTALYDVLTVQRDINTTTQTPNLKSSEVPTVKIALTLEKYSEIRHLNELHAPRANALKQEVTVPSDDDEDEGEGSGTYEDSRSQKRPAAAPAAPSSYLPANENGAANLFLNGLTALPLMFYLILSLEI